MIETRQQQDLDLWRKWKRTNDSLVLKELMDKLYPLIHRETSKWGMAVPAAALEVKAKILTRQALEDYNPNMGAAIATHVTSRLRKLSRSVYPQMNVARLPENKQLMFSNFSNVHSKMEEELGREPTAEELADELSWTPKAVNTFKNTIGRKELVESEGSQLDIDEESTPLVDFYYHGLTNEDKLLFQDITGYNKRPVLNNSQLTSKHNITQGQLSYKKKMFADKLDKVQKGY